MKRRLSFSGFGRCAFSGLVILGLFWMTPVQNADAKKNEEDKVKEFLKATIQLTIRWTVDEKHIKNQGSFDLQAQGLLGLNREMSSMAEGLPAVMVGYRPQNMTARYTYQETITDKDPPEDCPNPVIEKYERSGSTLCKAVPGPGNLIVNHFASMFKNTGLGHMASSMVQGMLFDHFLIGIPLDEIEVEGNKLDRTECENRRSTRKLNTNINISAKIEEDGGMRGRKSWTVKADSAGYPPSLVVRVNDLPQTMNSAKPLVPEMDADGDVTYVLSWEIEEIEPHILIYRLEGDDWHDITDAEPDEESQEIVLGEKLRLRAMVVKPGETEGSPDGQWEIQGEILKDWVASTSGTEEVEAEKDKKEIEFFWWKEPRSTVVRYRTADRELVGKTEFKLLMPEVQVDPEPGKGWGFSQNPPCELVPDTPSMRVTSTVSLPKDKPFCLEYVQLVQGNNWSLRGEATQFYWFEDVHDFMLDTTYPYNGAECQVSGSVAFSMEDTPGAPLPRLTALVFWDQEFQTYLMFRPGKPEDGNAWVPLRHVDWGWRVKAVSKVNPYTYEYPRHIPDRKLPLCNSRFDLSQGKLPASYPYRPKKADQYPKWSATTPATEFMSRTDHMVEDQGDNYRHARPPKTP
jgi:hypothetical protein